MSEIGGIGGRRHFSAEDEAALRRDDSTNTIIKRETRTDTNIYGTDRSWRLTKDHQQEHVGAAGALELLHAGFGGSELAGILHAGAAGAICGPVAGLALGIYSLGEAAV